MPRAKAIMQSDFPYNITARCINRDWFQIPMPRVWEIFSEELSRTSKDHELQVHSFVLMANHFHLIASTPRANISECMQQFMRRSSKRLTKEGNRINETFAGRHYKCILQHPNYFLNAYKYNYRNPVTAGVCDSVEKYPFSTLHGILIPSQATIQLAEDTTFISDPIGTIKWLNTAPDLKKWETFRCGLKHPYFRSKMNMRINKPLVSELDIL